MSTLHVAPGPPRLDHLFDMRAELGAPELIGEVAEGLRLHLYVTGGWFRGPRLSGEVLPVGGDWFLLRRDGVGQLDVRATLRTEDGALIYTWYSGLLYLDRAQREVAAAGGVPTGEFRLATAPMYRTGDARYLWLNRTLAVAKGWSDGTSVEYRVYRVDVGQDER